MAHWLKWLLGSAAALLLVSWSVGALVQWEPIQLRSDASPEQLRFAELSRELAAAHRSLQMLHRADSLASRLEVAGAGAGHVYIDAPAHLSSASREVLLAQAVEELPSDGSAAATIGIAVVSPMSGRRQDVGQAGLSHANELYAGRGESDTYCIAAGVSYVAERDSAFNFTLLAERYSRLPGVEPSALGACRLWARYGAPGDGVAAWLAAGGARFAEWLDSGIDTETFRPAPTPRGLGALQRSLGLSLTTRRCLAGDAGGCIEAITTSPVLFGERIAAERLPSDMWVYQRIGPWTGLMGGVEGALLADLERDIGAERFGAFWRGSGSVEDAYHAATGAPLGDWLLRWAQARYGDLPRGPGTDLPATLLSLLLITMALAAAVLVAQRRQV